MTSNRTPLLPVLTLTLWLSCLGVGVGGYFLTYTRPQRPIQVPHVEAEFIKVNLGHASFAPAKPTVAPSATADAPPPLPAPVQVQLPALFVDPVPDVVSVKSAPAPAAAPAAVTQLVYGQGQGAQPAPEYPREAALAGEEGVVVVRFTVDENGNVQTADAVKPCQWPILNQAAVRSIRDTWNFGAGPLRAYEISITYQLASH